jgi:hypothetical protein
LRDALVVRGRERAPALLFGTYTRGQLLCNYFLSRINKGEQAQNPTGKVPNGLSCFPIECIVVCIN